MCVDVLGRAACVEVASPSSVFGATTKNTLRYSSLNLTKAGRGPQRVLFYFHSNKITLEGTDTGKKLSPKKKMPGLIIPFFLLLRAPTMPFDSPLLSTATSFFGWGKRLPD